VRRITKAALGGIAGCTLVLGGTQAANSESSNVIYSSLDQQLTDLRPDFSGPLDGASATLRIIASPDEGIGFKVRVEGIDTSVVNPEGFGAHLHVGPCSPRLPIPGTNPEKYTDDTTGGHYTVPGEKVSSDSEVWLSFLPRDTATYETWALFEIEDTTTPGVMSIVLHRDPTAPDGVAGPREACLPVAVDFNALTN
jgi:hypothetical protein